MKIFSLNLILKSYEKLYKQNYKTLKKNFVMHTIETHDSLAWGYEIVGHIPAKEAAGNRAATTNFFGFMNTSKNSLSFLSKKGFSLASLAPNLIFIIGYPSLTIGKTFKKQYYFIFYLLSKQKIILSQDDTRADINKNYILCYGLKQKAYPTTGGKAKIIFKKISYFPIQNLLKIFPSKSSFVT
jgi:hypothetical protein